MARQLSVERLVALLAVAYVSSRILGSRYSSARPGGKAAHRAAMNATAERRVEEAEGKVAHAPDEVTLGTFASDLAKLLTTSTLDYLKGIAHGMQTLTGLLLTAYIALFVAFGKEYGFFELSPLVTGVPVACFGLSLLVGLIHAIAYRGGDFEYGDLESTLSAYEKAVTARKRQLLGPCVLTLLGIGSFAFVIAKAI